MKQALDKYGIAMPAFGKIGGLLAGEVCLIIVVASILHQYCIHVASILYQFCIDIAFTLHRYCTDIVLMLHRYCIHAESILHRCTMQPKFGC